MFHVDNGLCTAQKTIFFFTNVLKRWSFKKSRAGKWSLLYYQKRWYFFFPKNIILFFRQKMKDGLFQKNKWKYDIFFKYSEKMVFPKKLHWNKIFLVLSGKMIFLFPENMIWFFKRKMKDDLSKKIHGFMTFFSNAPKRWSFQKKSRCSIIFIVLSGKMVFFSVKYDIFLWMENERWSFSRNT